MRLNLLFSLKKVNKASITSCSFINIFYIDVNNSLLKLHKVADGNGDPQMCDFIEGNFLGEQVEAIKKLSDMVTQLNRVGEGKDRKKKI